MSKRDDQVLDVMGDHDLSTYAIAFMVFGKDKSMFQSTKRLEEMEQQLEDMATRGLLAKKPDTVAEYRTLWRKM